jgi:hypothetical protein
MDSIQKRCPPINAEEMRNMKINEDEKNRLEMIERKIIKIYDMAIKYAKSNNLEHKFLYLENQFNEYDFILEHQDEIIENLQLLFPSCSISIRIFSNVLKGKIIDITDFTEEGLQLINSENNIERLVIDWSQTNH